MKKLTAIVLLTLILCCSALSVSAASLELTAPQAGPLSGACRQTLVRGTAEAGKTVVVYVGGEYAGSVTAGKNGAFLLAVELDEGENLLSVSCEGQTLYRTVDFELEGIEVAATTFLTEDADAMRTAEPGFFQKLLNFFKNWFQ